MNDENSETQPSVKEQAETYFKNGDCCSEALVQTLAERFTTEYDPDIAKHMVTGLCGGMGRKQATCGVFTGGAVAISLLTKETSDRKKIVRKASSEFHQQLQDIYGSDQCEQILGKMGIKNWNRSQCRKLTGIGTEILEKLISKN